MNASGIGATPPTRPTVGDMNKVKLDTRRVAAGFNSAAALSALFIRQAPPALKIFAIPLAIGSLPESRLVVRQVILPKYYEFMGDTRSQVAVTQLNENLSGK
ncbi:MAG: hypothetical protein ACI9BD_000778 [Candidatus Marinamargulisbacteria bacterium]|jgi:hypothetical protein